MSTNTATTTAHKTGNQQGQLLEQVLPKLRPFQREALEFATKGKRYGRQWTTAADDGNNTQANEKSDDDTLVLDRRLVGKGRILLADEMGLGKTVTSLAIMAYYESEWPLLILCPASLRYTWPAEIEKFFPSLSPMAIYVAKGFQDVGFLKRRDVKVVICTYSLFQSRSAVQQALNSPEHRNHFRCIIADESHNLKSRTSQRSKLLLPLLQRSKRLLLLSGTPALARPEELWTQVSSLAPHFFASNWTAYANRYCNPRRKSFGGGRFVTDYSGSSNESELHAKLQNVMVRRLKSAVLQELPPKQRSVVPVTHSPESTAECKKIMKELADTRASVDQLVGSEAQSADAKARTLLMRAYQATGKAKAASVRDYLLDWLAGCSDQKILVFAHHKAVLDAVDEALLRQQANSHIRIDGSVPTEVRAQLVRKFQTCSRVRVALLSMTAAGVGLTLTAASTVMFAELHWTPGVLAQAEDRAHRIGQTHSSVQILYMVCKDSSVSVDSALWKLLGRKIRTLDQVVDGGKEAKPYLYHAREQAEHAPRAKSAQEDLTDFFSETSSSLGQKNTRKVPVKGSLDFFFKKAAAKESPTAPSGSSVKRQRSPRENYVLDIMCDVCTFENHAPNNVGEEWIPCEACGNLLKSNESEVSNKKLCSSDSPPGEKTSLGKTSWREETIFSWSCKTCTLSNSKPVSKRNWYACEACGEPHIDDAPESSSSPNDEFTEQLATPCVDRKLPPAVSTGATTTPNRRQTRESLSSPEVIVLDSPVDRPPSFISGSQVIEIDCADTPLVSKKQRAAKLSSPEVIVLDMEDDNPAGRKVVAKVSTNSRRKVVPRHAFEFSVSQHSGRMTVHFSDDGESSLVNFGVDEVLSERTADSLLDARIKKASVPKQQMQLEFDDASIRSLSLRVKTARASCRSSVLGNELKEFVANYLRLRAVERKTLQDSGKAFPGRSLSQAVAQLMTVSKTATERYAGGAKERARENADNGVASASDVSVLEGRSCAWCGTGMSGSAIKAGSTYCSQECAEEGRLRRGGKFAAVQIRAATFALEGGTCTICGMNAHDLFEQIRALQPPERLNKLLSANWALPKSSKALERLLNDPKEGNFWQVDHIRAVAEGGGSCGMENLRTLCVPCHTRETAQLHSRLKLHGAANSDEKHSQVDIRSAFLPAAAKSSRKGSLNQR